MSIIENYGPGSDFDPEELNDLQDHYVDGGFSPWITLGVAYQKTEGGVNYGGARAVCARPSPEPTQASADSTNAPPAFYIDPADYPMSHNGTLRALQWRLVVGVTTGTQAPPAAGFPPDVSIRSVTHNTGAISPPHVEGAKQGTVVLGTQTHLSSTKMYYGSPFTLTAAHYSMRWDQGASGPTFAQAWLIVARLQFRGI